MNCPKCNKEMKTMCWLGEMRLSNGIKRVEVLGHCNYCDLDATWKTDTDSTGVVTEYDIKRYFFG